jgi:hypothetical protein
LRGGGKQQSCIATPFFSMTFWTSWTMGRESNLNAR